MPPTAPTALTAPGDGESPAGPHLAVVRTRGDEVRSRLGELVGHIHAAQAEMVLLLGELDACGGWQGVGLRSIGHWASIELGIAAPAATRQAHAGRRLAGLPAVAGAALAGELGWDKLELLDRVVEPASQDHWLRLAREMSVGQLRRVVSAYRRAADDPTGHPDAGARRPGVWLFHEPDGLVRVTALLDADDAAVLRAALAAHVELLWRRDPTADAPADPAAAAAPEPGAEPASPSEVDPTRAAADPPAVRRADALVSLLRTALARPDLPDPADDSAQVVLHIDHDLLSGTAEVGRSHHAHGSSVPVATARRICCDAAIRTLVRSRDGRPLDLGRSTRSPNRALRRAVRLRDHDTCSFPGCTARHWLDVHHIVHWAHGGATDLDNLTLLCRHHHRLHHEGGYTITTTRGHHRFLRPDGTAIGPPAPPPPDPHRGATALRRRHAARGHTIDRHTPAARSGGAPHWSPQHALDALLS